MNELTRVLFKMSQVALAKRPNGKQTEKDGKRLFKTLKETYYKLDKYDKAKFIEEMREYE